MTVERIFAQLHDRTRWPALPERPLVPFNPADLIAVDPAELVAVSPAPWIPPPREGDDG